MAIKADIEIVLITVKTTYSIMNDFQNPIGRMKLCWIISIILNTAPIIPVSVSAGEGSYPDIKEIKEVLERHCNNINTLDATALACEAGNPITMNVVMLGAICASGVLPITMDVAREIIEKRTPTRLRDMNLGAFEKGFSALEG